MRHEAGRPYLASTIITMQLGVALTVLLGLMFISAGFFYLYTFNFATGPYFTFTRAVHFYAGIASIPFLAAKYGSTGLRFAGYYLRVRRFKEAGPPALLPRITSPLLALDFFALYFSGLYMLFHIYYWKAFIPPFNLKPEVLHLWTAILAVPLIAVHLGVHLLETAHGLSRERRALRAMPASAVLTRRAVLLSALFGGLGLDFALQNTSLANARVSKAFIGVIPPEDRGGPGAFPVETLFGKRELRAEDWTLRIDGDVERETTLTYAQLLALPATDKRMRLSCVSGWSANALWTGPRLLEVLATAAPAADWQSVEVESLSGYRFTWRRGPLEHDRALLATQVNGAPLSTNHGYPARVIVPGYPGQNMVKQVVRLTVRRETQPGTPDFDVKA